MTSERRSPAQTYCIQLLPMGREGGVSPWPPIIEVLADEVNEQSSHYIDMKLNGEVVCSIRYTFAAWWIKTGTNRGKPD